MRHSLRSLRRIYRQTHQFRSGKCQFFDLDSGADDTDTVDVIGTAIQVEELALAGSELVRLTVNTPEAAQAVPHVREQLDRMGIDVPLIGDFHFNGHRLLTDFPACAQALSKYRINPG